MQALRPLLVFTWIIVGMNLYAADQVVNNNSDSGAGSLRQAIVDVGDGEQITFNLSSGNETITISSELSLSAKGIIIDGDNTAGSGTNATIQVTTPGTSTYRVFNLNPGASKTVTISNVTINGGDISLQTSPGNRGGGIYLSSGTLNLTKATVSGSNAVFGGGIYSEGTMSIDKCRIQNNTVSHPTTTEIGGGIYNNQGTLTITNSTVSNNTSDGHAGGIFEYYGTLTITNSTIYGNICSLVGGGILVDFTCTFTLTNATIADNSSVNGTTDGIRLEGTPSEHTTLYIKNTILAHHLEDDFTTDVNCVIIDNFFNIVESSNGYAFIGFTDITGHSPNLNLSSTLADNNTLNYSQTLKTTSGSITIDVGGIGTNGTVSIPTIDQRGALRNVLTDIGAYEWWDNSGALPVELTSFTTSSTGSSVSLSWKTATEVNNAGFEVERRRISYALSSLEVIRQAGAGSWENISFISGAGTSNSPKEYFYSDANLASGRYAYRLKQVDHDGSYKYSQSSEIEVGLAPKVLTLSSNYPNPFNPTTTMEFTVPEDGRVSLKIYNMIGQLVAAVFDGDVKAGYTQKTIFDASRLSSGVYFSRLQFNDKSLMQKIVLMK